MTAQPTPQVPAGRKTVLLFTKPPVEGRVKTRLIGALSAAQAADLHAAFLGDLVERLSGADFELVPVWALEEGEPLPAVPPRGRRQVDGDLGARMRHAFTERLCTAPMEPAERFAVAIGSDLPQLDPPRVEEAFRAFEAGAEVVLGPAVDGGYYLIGLGAAALRAAIFEDIAWSTGTVLPQTLERCREAGLTVALLAEEEDIDTIEGLGRLAARLGAGELPSCRRTSKLLAGWLQAPGPAGSPGSSGAVFGGAAVEDPCVF